MDFQYDEQLIISAGLNIKLSKFTNFVDLLRIEFSQEMRKEIGLFYLKEITKNTQFVVFEDLPEKLPETCIVLFPDWSVLIKSKKFYQSILVSPLFVTFALDTPIYYLTLNHTKCISYKVLGVVAMFLNITNVPVFLQTFRKINMQTLALTTMACIKEMILGQSRVPQKALNLDMEEAREILRISNSSTFKPFAKPFLDILIVCMKPEYRKIEADLYDIIESSESLEHSPTQEISEIQKFSKKDLTIEIDKRAQEVTRKQTISECLEIKLVDFLDTPLSSPKQSNFSIIEIQNLVNLNGPNSDNISEKPTILTEPTISLEYKNICSCISCQIF